MCPESIGGDTQLGKPSKALRRLLPGLLTATWRWGSVWATEQDCYCTCPQEASDAHSWVVEGKAEQAGHCGNRAVGYMWLDQLRGCGAQATPSLASRPHSQGPVHARPPLLCRLTRPRLWWARVAALPRGLWALPPMGSLAQAQRPGGEGKGWRVDCGGGGSWGQRTVPSAKMGLGASGLQASMRGFQVRTRNFQYRAVGGGGLMLGCSRRCGETTTSRAAGGWDAPGPEPASASGQEGHGVTPGLGDAAQGLEPAADPPGLVWLLVPSGRG